MKAASQGSWITPVYLQPSSDLNVSTITLALLDNYSGMVNAPSNLICSGKPVPHLPLWSCCLWACSPGVSQKEKAGLSSLSQEEVLGLPHSTKSGLPAWLATHWASAPASCPASRWALYQSVQVRAPRALNKHTEVIILGLG